MKELRRYFKIVALVLLLLIISVMLFYVYMPKSMDNVLNISSEEISYVDIHITPSPSSKEDPYSIKNIKDRKFIEDTLFFLSNQTMRRELFQSTKGYDLPFIYVAFALQDGSFVNIDLNQGYRIKLNDKHYILHGDGIDVKRLEQQALMYKGLDQ